MTSDKFNKNLEKVIKQLCIKKINSREYKKYQKILGNKFDDIMRYKKARTRDCTIEQFNKIKEKNEVIIPKDLKKSINIKNNKGLEC